MKVKFIYGMISATIVFSLSTIFILNAINTFATDAPLNWQQETDVQFTFNPALSVSLSSGDIVIDNLGVGTRDDSNEITITVKTNNVAGYQLSATVGNSTTYNTRNLKHDTSNTAIFSSINTGTSVNQLSTPSTWGYSIDSGTTYSGLPKYDDTSNVAILNDSNASGTENTTFLIGAYADQNQLAGDYRNVINFNVVTNMVKYTIADAPDMQSVASGTDGCPSTLPTGQAYELTDNRDGEVYKVARLADGKCWLLDNLRLDLTNSTVLNTLSSANTNIDSATETATLTSLMSGNRSAGNQYATAGVSNWTSDYSYSAPLIATSGNCFNTTNCVNDPESGKWHKDATTTSYGAGSGKIGVYYNYCAASAGTYCYGNGTSSGTSSGNATEDICPKGWRMPTGGDSGEYQALYTAYSSNAANFQNALSTPLSGYIYSGSAWNQGSDDGFWSSTRYSDSGMYYLYVYSSGVFPSYYVNRIGGYSVRCLLQ